MRRRAAGLAAVALLLAGGLFVSSNGLGRAGAETTTCVWTKHTKHVVKHLRRHGKLHRVVRIKHYRTCRKVAVQEPTTTTPTTTAPAEPAPTPTTPVVVSPEPEANALGVAAYDQGGYRYALSRQTVRPGQLTLQLDNRGEDPHSMDMQKVGENGELEGTIVEIPKTEPGKPSASVSVDVEPGTYRMWCTIGHHAEEGMETEVTVE
jgi:plastocyanin